MSSFELLSSGWDTGHLSLMTTAKLLNVMSLYLNYLLLLFLHRLPRVPGHAPSCSWYCQCWAHLVLAGEAYKGNYGMLGKSFSFWVGQIWLHPSSARLLSDLSLTFISINLTLLFDEQANGSFAGFQGGLELNLKNRHRERTCQQSKGTVSLLQCSLCPEHAVIFAEWIQSEFNQ